MRRMTASCWKSFSPNTATSGAAWISSLATMVATPVKWKGRETSSRPAVAGPVRLTVVAAPGGYMVGTSGA